MNYSKENYVKVFMRTQYDGIGIIKIENDYILSQEFCGNVYKKVTKNILKTSVKGGKYFTKQGEYYYIESFK